MNYPEPTTEEPSLEELEEELADASCTATDGCGSIEPDGTCQHGYPSWPLHLGLI